MNALFFSIIIPTYNRKSFLRIAINSVLQQTFENYELLIVDDGSTDNSSEIIKQLSNKKIKYFNQEHIGVSAARNTGINHARGDFICFLDSDDRFCREKLQVTANYIKRYPAYKIFHTEEIWYQRGRLLAQKKYHKKPSGFVFEQALKLCCLSMSTAVISKDIFAKVGLFDETLPACEDYDFWLRVTSGYPVFLIPEYLTIKEGGHPDQQSKRYPAMDKFRIYALAKLLKKEKLNSWYYKLAAEVLENKCSIYIQGAARRGKIKEANYYKRLIQCSRT